MMYVFLFLIACVGVSSQLHKKSNLRDFLKDTLCDCVRLEGPISDSQCDFESVNEAVTYFYAPLLSSLSTSTFFKYFKVDLHRNCPFWHEEGKCMMEGCSVCTCDEREIPQNWLYSPPKQVQEFAPPPEQHQQQQSDLPTPSGWISAEIRGTSESPDLEDRLGRVQPTSNYPAQSTSQAITDEQQTQYLQETEDDWTYVDDDLDSPAGSTPLERLPPHSNPYAYLASFEQPPAVKKNPGAFVNLLQNPERFTGYSGPSASRVWRAIQEENCFSKSTIEQEQCLEKRTFHRLMSGLQASISTHIAMGYYYAEPKNEWGVNVPLFIKAVGSHRDRMVNLYFTFLFVLRAVTKAEPILTAYSFDTGNITEDMYVKSLITRLTTGSAALPSKMVQDPPEDQNVGHSPMSGADCDENNGLDSNSKSPRIETIHRCRNGFDERRLFSVIPSLDSLSGLTGLQTDNTPYAKKLLQQEFRNRFRNITRIMDCVSCEKCKVWGKLQILGLGTAIKILLTPSAELAGWGGAGSLSRQEIVALINTLNQLAKSVKFAAEAMELELDERIEQVGENMVISGMSSLPIVLMVAILCIWGWNGEGGRRSDDQKHELEGVNERAERKRGWVG